MSIDFLGFGRASFIGAFMAIGVIFAMRNITGRGILFGAVSEMPWWVPIAFVGLSYGVGITVETTADRYAEELDSPWFPGFPKLAGMEDSLKVSALFDIASSPQQSALRAGLQHLRVGDSVRAFEVFPSGSSHLDSTIVAVADTVQGRLVLHPWPRASVDTTRHYLYSPDPLADELASRLTWLLQNDSTVIRHIIHEAEDFNTLNMLGARVGEIWSSPVEMANRVKPVYYVAKNVVFQHPQHFAELREVAERSEFTRGLAMAAPWVLVFTVVGVVGGVGWVARLTRRHRLGHAGASRRHVFLELARRHLLLQGLVAVIVTCLLYYLSLRGYQYEEVEFNRRAFGYFVTFPGIYEVKEEGADAG